MGAGFFAAGFAVAFALTVVLAAGFTVVPLAPEDFLTVGFFTAWE